MKKVEYIYVRFDSYIHIFDGRDSQNKSFKQHVFCDQKKSRIKGVYP